MDQEIIALNSDRINRYGFYFALSDLEKSIKDSFDMGLPMCIGHDLHRAYGWVVPFALYFEPHITRVLGKKFVATSVEEFRRFMKAHEHFLQSRYYEAWQPFQQPFIDLIGKQLSSSHMRVDIGCVSVYDPGILQKAFPDLLANKDGDGLLPLSVILSKFTYLGQGIFKDKESELAIFAHSYFRRSQSLFNNFHFHFLDELLALGDYPDISIKLCISEDIIGYSPSYHETMELEYHWGPKFTDDIDNIKVGLTRYECNDFERAYYGISRNEFYWKKDGNEVTFEMEELRDNPSPFETEETYHCRYLHSIYKVDVKRFVHFDGAIRTYNIETMLDRLDKTFLQFGRKALYKKLFRIDGLLPLHLWKLLTTHYLQGNPLIYEYFGLDQDKEIENMQPREISKVKELLPYSIEKEDGIRLLVSYHSPGEDREGRYIDCFDIMSNESETIECLENSIYEVKKSLQHVGEDLDIPKYIKMVKIDDRYWNIPSIMHAGPNTIQLLGRTVEAIRILFEAMVKAGKDKDVTFTLGCKINNRIIRVSSFGNILRQIEWMKENLPFPLEEDPFSEWANRQRTYIEQFQAKSDDPLITSIVQGDGVLFIKRKQIHLPYEFFEEQNEIKFRIKMPSDEDELYSLIQQQKVRPKLMSIIKEARWSDTDEDYYTSSRSKFIDNTKSTAVRIAITPLALYWSRD
ncbi:MAG TPA: hypothetical protein VFE32_14645 [Puia sp.]|jgi:hypothetical protein|nr:hypothetical protein [Puia sp.]